MLFRSCIGVFMIGVAVEGYLFTKVNIVVRLVAFGGALALIDPGLYTDMIGFLILVAVTAFQKFLAGKQTQASLTG